MKNSGFKKKEYGEYKPMKRTPLKKVSENKVSYYKNRKRKEKLGLPSWIKAIPESTAHGSGTYERRLWKLTSDFVRIRDWNLFDKKCVATGEYIEHWSQGQAGHYRAYSICNNMFKFDPRNIHMQKAKSNMLSSMSDGKRFGDELDRRYGIGFVDKLEKENLEHKGKYYSKEDVINQIKDLINLFEHCIEQPEYVVRSRELLSIDNC